MRAINLIPPDARRGDAGPMRAGAVSYVVIGALALALLGVIALGLTSKQISDRETEVSSLEQQLQEATERAQSLSSFATFRGVQETRTATVASLAQSRFDWERVMNELALIIPEDVWLTELGGSVSPAVEVEDAPDIEIRSSVTGPALELIGCATGLDAVAGFVADLEDIDGVTRVGVASSERQDTDAQATAGETAVSSDSAGDGSDECRTRDWITRFEIVVAFDAVPVPATATAAPGVPAPAAPTTGASSGSLAASGAQQDAASAQAAQQTSETETASPAPEG